jgi:hypothetical protein
MERLEQLEQRSYQVERDATVAGLASVTSKQVPPPSRGTHLTLPPWWRATWRTRARPRPTPPSPRSRMLGALRFRIRSGIAARLFVPRWGTEQRLSPSSLDRGRKLALRFSFVPILEIKAGEFLNPGQFGPDATGIVIKQAGTRLATVHRRL